MSTSASGSGGALINSEPGHGRRALLFVDPGAPARAAAAPVAPVSGDAALLASARREFERAESHYRRSVGQLQQIALEDSSSWARPRRRSYQRDLALIEDAVARFRRTARIAPADPVAQEMLYGAYRRQMRVMQDAILDVQLAGFER